MNDTRYIVDDQEVELLPDTLIEVTIKSLELGDITKRFVNHTSSFKIPFTKNNLPIYGLANSRQSKTTIPYKKRSVKLVVSGNEIISSGAEKLTKVNDYFQTSVYDNSLNFYETIGNKFITDLDLSGFTVLWQTSTIANYRNTTTGIVAPVVDYGYFNGADIQVDYVPPCIYYKNILDRIFVEAGYTYSGAIFSSDRYLKMVIPFAGDSPILLNFGELLPGIYQSDFIKDFIVTFGLIPYEKNKNILFKSFNEIITGTLNSFSITRFRSNEKSETGFVPLRYGYKNYFKYLIPSDVDVLTLGQGLFTLTNYDSESDKTIHTSFFNASKLVTISGLACAYIPLYKGEIATFTITAAGSGLTNGTFDNVTVLGGSGTGATAKVTVAGSAVTLIEIKQKGINYKPGDSITLNGFAAVTATTGISTDRYFDNPITIRKLMVRSKRGPEPNIKYNGVAYSDYLIGYFVDGVETNDCNYQKSIDNDYSLLVSSLQLSRIESQTYFLNAVHLNKFTPHTLLFDRDSYYLLNSLKFTNGFLSKLELFKIG